MRRLGIFLVFIALPIFAQAELRLYMKIEGPSGFGKMVAGADVNGDGYVDVIVGSPDENSNTGAAYLYYGGDTPDTVLDKYFAGTSSEYFGNAICGCGDINGDGYEDIAIGGWAYNSYIGRVCIYYGGLDMDTNADSILMPSGMETFGYSLRSADMDGDGEKDLLVGAPYGPDGSGYGLGYIFYDFSNEKKVFQSPNSLDLMGMKVHASDLNGDDTLDLILSSIYAPAYSEQGMVLVYWGGADMDTIPDIAIVGDAGGDHLGSGIGSGDVNGDGYDDLLVGVPGKNLVYIYYGGPSFDNIPDDTLNGEGGFGTSVCGGDFTQDGYAEVIIGAPTYNSNGAVFIYLGAPTLPDTPDIALYSTVSGEEFGYFVDLIGDVNGDGFTDLAVGTGAGTAAYIYKGANDFDLPAIAVVSTPPDTTSSFGPYHVAAVITDASGISWDTLYYNYGAGFMGVSHDTIIGDTFFFTIPELDTGFTLPFDMEWYIAAADSFDPVNNVTCDPPGGASSPYTFTVIDTIKPVITYITHFEDTDSTGPFEVLINAYDPYSEVLNAWLYYIDSEVETVKIAMFPTDNPDEYSGWITVQYYPSIILYWVEVEDISGNMKRDPVDEPTPYGFHIGPYPGILLVDKDGGVEYDTFYTHALDFLGMDYYHWDCSKLGSPRYLMTKGGYDVVIWMTGDANVDIMTEEEMDTLASYLDRGGNLFVTSQYLGEVAWTTSFYSGYLHAQYYGTTSEIMLEGKDGDPIGDGDKDTILIYGTWGAQNAVSQDIVLPINGADTVYYYVSSYAPGAIRYGNDTTYKVVYFAFPFEAIGGSPYVTDTKENVLQRILSWFGYTPHYIPPRRKITEEVVLEPVRPGVISDELRLVFWLPEAMDVKIELYNALGRKVATVLEGTRERGRHEVTWNAAHRLTPGVYYVRMETDEKTQTEKVLFIR
ncbi:hypothetical protein DRQ20_00680 [bacterium]|nr:MAG: hypothetical protein DRQ20_00680 [bacterium]